MTDRNDDDNPPAPSLEAEAPTETPVQRALRIKQAIIDARPKPPRGGRFQREQSARVAAGKSKPWMKK